MNSSLKSRLAVLVCAGVLWAARPAFAQDEAATIAALKAAQSPAQKDQACQRLKLIGTEKAVPALAELLVDEQLSHSARYALETIPGEQASAALRDALGRTKGAVKAGIIDSLGARRDVQVTSALATCLADSDPMVVSSAGAALGRIGGPEAVAALAGARQSTSGQRREVIVDALLTCAEGQVAAQPASALGMERAADIYGAVYNSTEPEHQRTAAFLGLVLTSGANGTTLVRAALQGKDAAALKAALQLVREIKGAQGTRAFAAALPKMSADRQPALIQALAQRGDSAAAGAVAALVTSPSPQVRQSALSALGFIGDSSVAVLLAKTAASSTGAEQEAARTSLASLRDPKVCDVLLVVMPKAEPLVQAEIVRALGQRQDTAAVGALLKMAQTADEPARLLALRSLATLADATQVKPLIALVISAATEAQRDAAEQALASAAARAPRPEASAPEIVAAMKGADLSARIALLRVAGRLGGTASLAALRDGLRDREPALVDAALRTMADFGPADAAGDLLSIAADKQRSMAHHVLALRGYWRLVGASAGRPADERWRMCQAGLGVCARPEDLRLGLSEMAKIPHLAALQRAQQLCDNADVRTEAQSACIRIAAALAGTNPTESRDALRAIEKTAASDDIRAEARKVLSSMNQYAGYITAWAVAGPFRQAGRQCAELFDVAFAPEKGGAKVEWKALAPPADPTLFWQADLLPVCDGDQCVVYVKSRVFCARQQNVKLEIGSDDGNKIWLNGKLVHAKNVMRPIQPAQDSANATLKEGWNDFLIKITQNNQGCAVCVRIRNTDGSPIDGLRFESGLPAKGQ